MKTYELTTNGDDGYRKYFVKGIKTDSQAKKIAKRGFGKFYWAKGISYYSDNIQDANFTKLQFLKVTKRLRKK